MQAVLKPNADFGFSQSPFKKIPRMLTSKQVSPKKSAIFQWFTSWLAIASDRTSTNYYIGGSADKMW